MPGFAGIVSHRAPFNDAYEVVEVFRRVHHLEGVNFVEKTFQTEHCVIVNFMTGILKSTLDQPAVDAAGNTFLFLEGEIFNFEELRGYLNEDSSNFSPCDVLLALFLKHGADFAALVNGEFNIVIYQKAEGRLAILNDQLSSKPLYYLEESDRLLFGSELKSIQAIAAGSAEIDPVGILQIFAHRHYVGGRTFIKGLKCLPPASYLEYRGGRLRLTRRPLMSFNVPKPMPKINALIDEWERRLKQATARRLAGKDCILMSLSAGLDSRAVSCSIPRNFRPLPARTIGHPDSLEVIYATKIAKRLGFNHFREDPGMVPLSQVLHKIVWRTEGMIQFINGMTMMNHSFLKEQSDFFCGGWFGDASSGAHLRPFMIIPSDRRQFIEKAYQWYILYPEKILRKVFNEAFLHQHLPSLRQAFLDSFDPLESETNIQIFELWDLYERQTRMTFTSAHVDTHLFEHVRPFLDKDYLEFALTIPTQLRFGQVLYQAMIHQIGPEIRDIPNSNTDLTLKGTVKGNLLNMGISWSHIAGTKLLKKLRPSFKETSGQASVWDLASVVRNDVAIRRVIEEFIESPHFDSAIFNRAGILDLLDAHYQGGANYAWLICLIATFSVTLPYFVYEKHSCCPSEAEPLIYAEKIRATA